MSSAEPTPESTTESNTDSLAPSESEGTGSGINEAWAPLLDALPEQLRTMESVTNPLKEWDKNYQTLQEQYKPFKELPDEWRDPLKIGQAITIFDKLQNDTNGFLKELADYLGVSLADAKEIVKEQAPDQKPETPVVPLEFTDEDDPRMAAMAKQLKDYEAKFDTFFQNQTAAEQKRINDQMAVEEGKKIDAQVTKLISDNVIQNDPTVLKDLMMRAKIALDQGSRDPIADAVKSQQETFGVIKGMVAPKEQPQNLLFMPTNGAAPANGPKPPDLSTANGRIEMARQIAQLSKS